MWKNIKIKEECLMFKCNIEEEKNEVKFLLTNLKEIWCEYCLVDDVLLRAKECNKRIEYDRETILETIQNIPKEYDFVEIENVEDIKNFVLKYFVSNRPFNFTWKLQKCTQDELLNLIIQPLLISVCCLTKQSAELKIIIEKKDAEIAQYKQEGAILRRSKIATEPFQKEMFEAKYPMKRIIDMIQLADINYESFKSILESEFIANPSTKEPSSVSSISSLARNKQRTPKKGKKFIKLQLSQTKQRMKTEETKISYDDSDSCTPPINLNEIQACINESTSTNAGTIETDEENNDNKGSNVGNRNKDESRTKQPRKKLKL